MKKTALLLSCVASSLAFASAGPAAPYGFYAGVHGGVAQTHIKHHIQNGAPSSNPMAINRKSHSGKADPHYGAWVGYLAPLGDNHLACFEVFAQGSNTHVQPLQDAPTKASKAVHTLGQTHLRRKFSYGGMLRVGHMITPRVMGYVGLGCEMGKWDAEFIPDRTINGVSRSEPTTLVSKKHLSCRFVSGADMFLTPLTFARLQYHYVTGPKINLDYDCSAVNPQSSFYGTKITQTMKISQHVVSLGFGRRF